MSTSMCVDEYLFKSACNVAGVASSKSTHWHFPEVSSKEDEIRAHKV